MNLSGLYNQIPWSIRTRLNGGRGLVGLDIGTMVVKLVQLRRKGERLELENIQLGKLPHGTIQDGEIINPEALTQCIKALVKKAHLTGAECAISFSSVCFVTKTISVPSMSKKDLEISDEWAEEHCPIDIQEVNIESQIINPDIGMGEMRILATFIKKTVVKEYVSAVTLAGLRPTIIDEGTMAAANSVLMNHPGNQTIGFIDAGASTMEFSIYSRDQVLFTRTIEMGGETLVEQAMSILNMSREEADYLMFGKEDPDPETAISIQRMNIKSRVFTTLTTELQRKIIRYNATYNANGENKITKFYLSGGLSIDPQFRQTLEDRFGIPVEVLNPLKKVIVDPVRFYSVRLGGATHFLATAIGLAMRSPGDSSAPRHDPKFRLNLIGGKDPFIIAPKLRKNIRIPGTNKVVQIRIN